MAKVSCPFCYNRIDSGQLWFQCIGRGSPGKEGCKPQLDAARVQETGIDELVLPSFPPPRRGLRATRSAMCPHCGGETGVRVCPMCHTKMPAEFDNCDSPLIAMIGAPGTGKSVYLKTLANRLRKDMRRHFQADVRLVGDRQFAADGRADFLDPAGALFGDRVLYAQTLQAQDGRREPIVFSWRQHKRRPAFSRFDTTYLSFYDTAGDDLIADTSTEGLRYLEAADALILLLDPFMIPHARDQISLPASALKSAHTSTVDVVGRVTDSLRRSPRHPTHKMLSVPVAVVFAKIDAFFDLLGPGHPLVQRPPQGPFYDETLGRATHEHVRTLLHQWQADDIDSHLTLNYKTFRYFAVSSLGAEPDYDRQLVDERGPQPFRVDEPMLWLLSRFGVVPTGGRDER